MHFLIIVLQFWLKLYPLDVIDRLKAEKRGKSEINKKELDLKIAKYKIYYNECIHISNHLMDRYYGA